MAYTCSLVVNESYDHMVDIPSEEAHLMVMNFIIPLMIWLWPLFRINTSMRTNRDKGPLRPLLMDFH